MEAKKISLNDYVLFGGGANGESYDFKADPSIMLKLYFPGKIQQPLDEMLLARKVYEIGSPTPEPGEYVVTEDGRYGSDSTGFPARNPIPGPRPTIRSLCPVMPPNLPRCARSCTPFT